MTLPSIPPSSQSASRLGGPPPGVPADALLVAMAGRVHGLRGEFRLVPVSGDPARLAGITQVWIPDEDDPVPQARRVVGFRVHGDAALVRLENVNSREDAARLTRSEVWARAGELPPWGPDAFGLVDVVGAQLFDGGERVGEVLDIVTNADRDFFEVERDGQKVLVPAVKDWLVELDLPGKRIVMRLPVGLFE